MTINKKINHKDLWIDSMIGMTWGFMATLIIGTIIGLWGLYSKHNVFVDIKNVLSYITPFGIGIGVGIKLKIQPLQIFAVGIGAMIAGQTLFKPTFHAGSINFLPKAGINTTQIFLPGDIFGSWLTAVLIIYIFKIFLWDNYLDIFLVPFIGIVIGIICAFSILYLTSFIVVFIQWILLQTINKVRLLGIFFAPIIGIIMGLALSLPTSSAAIAFAINLKGDAAVAAIAATAAQMMSFGVMTYMATQDISQSFAVAFGTSMLQMQNYMKKYKILIIPTIVSAIAALIATISFPMLEFSDKQSVTSGMGTAALYGQIFTLKENGWANEYAWINIICIQLLLPIFITIPLAHLFFIKKIINRKDLELWKSSVPNILAKPKK